MSIPRNSTCGVLAAILSPLLLALFLAVSILAYLYSLPSGQLAASGLSYFVGRAVPPVSLPPGSPVVVPPGPEALEPYREMIATAAGRIGVEPRLIMADLVGERC